MPNIVEVALAINGPEEAIKEIWEKGTKTAVEAKRILESINDNTTFNELKLKLEASDVIRIKKLKDDDYGSMSDSEKVRDIRSTLGFWKDWFNIADVIKKDLLTDEQIMKIKKYAATEKEFDGWMKGEYSYDIARKLIGTKWEGFNWNGLLSDFEPDGTNLSLCGQTAWSPFNLECLSIIRNQYNLEWIEQKYESVESEFIGFSLITKEKTHDYFYEGSNFDYDSSTYKEFLKNNPDVLERCINKNYDRGEQFCEIYPDYCDWVWDKLSKKAFELNNTESIEENKQDKNLKGGSARAQ